MTEVIFFQDHYISEHRAIGVDVSLFRKQDHLENVEGLFGICLPGTLSEAHESVLKHTFACYQWKLLVDFLIRVTQAEQNQGLSFFSFVSDQCNHKVGVKTTELDLQN